VRGKYPAIGIGESFGIKASVAAAFITKLEGTADFEKAGGAIVQIEASGGDAVDFDALTNWMAKSGAAQRMPQVCNNFFGPRGYLSRQRGFSNQQSQLRPRR